MGRTRRRRTERRELLLPPAGADAGDQAPTGEHVETVSFSGWPYRSANLSIKPVAETCDVAKFDCPSHRVDELCEQIERAGRNVLPAVDGLSPAGGWKPVE